MVLKLDNPPLDFAEVDIVHVSTSNILYRIVSSGFQINGCANLTKYLDKTFTLPLSMPIKDMFMLN